MQVNLLIAVFEGFASDGRRSPYKAFQTHAHDSRVEVYARGFVRSRENQVVKMVNHLIFLEGFESGGVIFLTQIQHSSIKVNH
jgi:hypothetical protein